MSSELVSALPQAGSTAQVEPLLAFADALRAEEQGAAGQAPFEIRQYVAFMLGEVEYGIPILQCREIVRLGVVTRIPEAPVQVRGVVNLRGHVVPAIDTRRCLGLEPAAPTARSRLLVVELSGRLFGLIVDRVARILRLTTAQVAAAMAPEGGSATGVANVEGALVHLLDAERVLRGPVPPLAAKEGDQP